jgi:hypothetical protein
MFTLDISSININILKSPLDALFESGTFEGK